MRARWSHRLTESPLLDTAFALEAVLDEVVFITGPVLVTVLATTVHPALGLGVSAVVGLVGALLLAAQRDTQPPIQPHHRDDVRPKLPLGVLAPVVAACVALGAVFGSMEVVVIAFAKERGLLPFAGFFITAWSFGSLLAGVITGSVVWRSPPSRRFRLGATALALLLVPLLFVSSPLLIGALLLISGMAIAPTLIASVAVVQSAVPASRLTEALSWNTTGLAVGLAAGAAGAGQLIDLFGSRGGFGGVVGAAGLLVVAALCVRGGRQAGPISPVPPGTPAVGPAHLPAGSPIG